MSVLKRLLLSLITLIFLTSGSDATAIEGERSWEQIDKEVKTRVFHLNVGIKIRLKDGSYATLTDLSPKYKMPVFATANKDMGYRVVGFGTSFPIKTQNASTFFITNHHVVNSHAVIVLSCQKFFAAMRLYAEQTAHGSQVEDRFNRLKTIVSLPREKRVLNTQEKITYAQTVDGIWNCYKTYLSTKADRGRLLFKKYLSAVEPQFEVGYFLHPAGSATKLPIRAAVHKIANARGNPDLAILKVAHHQIKPIELDPKQPSEGQEIQAIGYAIASDALDEDSGSFYAPTFNTGRISRVTPKTLQVDAAVTTGMSGGPVINKRGKVIGVVAKRFKNSAGFEVKGFSAAVSANIIRDFAPELFGR